MRLQPCYAGTKTLHNGRQGVQPAQDQPIGLPPTGKAVKAEAQLEVTHFAKSTLAPLAWGQTRTARFKLRDNLKASAS